MQVIKYQHLGTEWEPININDEFGYATYNILHSLGTLRKIYFTNTPLGYDKFNSNLGLSFDTFSKNLYNNSNYQNELAFFRKTRASKDLDFRYNCERDFYDALKDMYGKVLLLQSRGNLVIGLESLLDKNQNVIQSTQYSISDDDEYEL